MMFRLGSDHRFVLLKYFGNDFPILNKRMYNTCLGVCKIYKLIIFHNFNFLCVYSY